MHKFLSFTSKKIKYYNDKLFIAKSVDKLQAILLTVENAQTQII